MVANFHTPHAAHLMPLHSPHVTHLKPLTLRHSPHATHLKVPTPVLQIELSTSFVSSRYLCKLLCQPLACLPVWYITVCLI
jgi:hypothetical protein